MKSWIHYFMIDHFGDLLYFILMDVYFIMCVLKGKKKKWAMYAGCIFAATGLIVGDLMHCTAPLSRYCFFIALLYIHMIDHSKDI